MIFFVCCILGLCAFSLGAGGVLFKEQFVRKQNKDSLEPHSLKNALDTLESPSSEKTSQSSGYSTCFDPSIFWRKRPYLYLIP